MNTSSILSFGDRVHRHGLNLVLPNLSLDTKGEPEVLQGDGGVRRKNFGISRGSFPKAGRLIKAGQDGRSDALGQEASCVNYRLTAIISIVLLSTGLLGMQLWAL